MQIQVNSDNNVKMSENFAKHIREVIDSTIHNYESQITRIEVHLSDENASKTGANDKRCAIEARLAGRKPMAVTDQADTLDEAISGAAEKLKHALVSILGKEHDHHPRIKADIGIFAEDPPEAD